MPKIFSPKAVKITLPVFLAAALFLLASFYFPKENGTIGKIIKIETAEFAGQQGLALTVRGADNSERMVVVENKTPVHFRTENRRPSDLGEGDEIIVVGEPGTAGRIDACFLRVIKTAGAK